MRTHLELSEEYSRLLGTYKEAKEMERLMYTYALAAYAKSDCKEKDEVLHRGVLEHAQKSAEAEGDLRTFVMSLIAKAAE